MEWTSTIYNAARASCHGRSARTANQHDLRRRGRNSATVDGLGSRTSTLYDAAGQSVATVDPLNRITTVYDLAGRTKATINPLGR